MSARSLWVRSREYVHTLIYRSTTTKKTSSLLLCRSIVIALISRTCLYHLSSRSIVVAAYILKRPICTFSTTWSRRRIHEVIIKSLLIILARIISTRLSAESHWTPWVKSLYTKRIRPTTPTAIRMSFSELPNAGRSTSAFPT